MRVYFLGICLSLFPCSTPGHGSRARSQAESLRISSKQAQEIIAARARQVILALKSRNVGGLSFARLGFRKPVELLFDTRATNLFRVSRL